MHGEREREGGREPEREGGRDEGSQGREALRRGISSAIAAGM